MSAATATLIAGGLAILGTLLGVVVERLMRLVGRLRCEASLSSLALTGIEEEPGYPRSIPLEEADEPTEATGVNYECAIDLFNGREMPTGLRNARMELVRGDGGAPLRSIPLDRATVQRGEYLPGIPVPVAGSIDDLVVINFRHA